MRFHDRLWEMTKKGEAFRFKSQGYVHVLVPEGKYTGLWKYNTKTRRVYWENNFDLRTQNVFVNKKDRHINLPLPLFVYQSTTGANINKWWELHAKPEEFGLKTEYVSRQCANWKAFKETYVDKAERRLQQVREWNEAAGFSTYYPSCWMAICYAWDILEEQMTSEGNEKRVNQAMEDFRALSVANVWSALTCHQRHVLVRRTLQFGFKKAMKLTFRKLHPQTRNALIKRLREGSLFQLPVLLKAGQRTKTAFNWSSEPLSWEQLNYGMGAAQRAESLGMSHQDLMWYLRKNKDQIRGACGILTALEVETVAAQALDIPVNLPEKFWMDQAGMRRIHDQLVEAIQDKREEKEKARYKLHAERHKQNWAALGKVPPEFTPLLTRTDFKLEGAQMHHCISGYFANSHSLYAHVEYKGEQASVMFSRCVDEHDREYYEINQLYGHCNKVPSDEMDKFVYSWVSSLGN